MVITWSISLKLLALKVFAFTLLSVYSHLTFAYDDWYISVLRSLNNAKEASSNVTISRYFFDPKEAVESIDDYIKNLAKGDDIDKALAFDGRVSKNIVNLLSDTLEKQFLIKKVDWKESLFNFSVKVIVVQTLDMYGENLFHIKMDIEFQELATTRSGKTGFMHVYNFVESNAAYSKFEIEAKIYALLDKVTEKMQETYSQSEEYCSKEVCKLQ